MKKFHFHADALICVIVLVVLSLAGNLFLFLEMRRLGEENLQIRVQTTLDALNLGSLRASLDECLEGSKDQSEPNSAAN